MRRASKRASWAATSAAAAFAFAFGKHIDQKKRNLTAVPPRSNINCHVCDRPIQTRCETQALARSPTETRLLETEDTFLFYSKGGRVGTRRALLAPCTSALGNGARHSSPHAPSFHPPPSHASLTLSVLLGREGWSGSGYGSSGGGGVCGGGGGGSPFHVREGWGVPCARA